MKNADVERLTVKLKSRRAELEALQEISADSRAAVELDQSGVGRISRVDALQAQQMALAVDRNRSEELNRIAAALARVDDGSYGECLVCGEDIALKRLELDPAAAACIDCARSRKG